MDPDVTLTCIRALLDKNHLTTGEAQELQERVAGLDQWLSRGGFLPTAWQR